MLLISVSYWITINRSHLFSLSMTIIENRLALAFVTLAIAAIVTGMTTVSSVQVAQAQDGFLLVL
jgi:hypothetical protein